MPALARALRERAEFVVIGDGGRRAALEAAIVGLDNVRLYPPIARAELLEAYRTADVLFLHLGALAAFEKVLPSKIFEYGALGKPVLAGVAGFAADFIRAEIDNAAVFAPCDAAAAAAAFATLEIADRPRPRSSRNMRARPSRVRWPTTSRGGVGRVTLLGLFKELVSVLATPLVLTVVLALAAGVGGRSGGGGRCDPARVRRRRRLRKRCRAGRVRAIAPLEHRYPPRDDAALPRVGYVVVLGSSYSPDGAIPVTSRSR